MRSVAAGWSRPNFERPVEELRFRMFDGGSGRVIAVNGRGGDAGINVQVTTDAGLRRDAVRSQPRPQ
ncbi:conserved hypothetical protein [Streptomyces sviceus ATCC 29083]|uniref:Uncharacterized protein n=1 Tax=Streptomyces sviceus (strain ATCC 29083 / DSM 924 / JCM 4929 / NBRC 13980 / NCIMB 11184 / NRRL 5439 / UC 5370) TaxID=463191 RepID=B5HS50_STRX2|nr:conserved hypothetical protein [Streptomyces sviceus ATCC 29083]